jgi:V/A-type H+-transporting ATPase subunit I
MFRPQPAQWFQMLVLKEDLPLALSVLATFQGIELEEDASAHHTPILTPELSHRMARFNILAERYQAYWPPTSEETALPFYASPMALLDGTLLLLDHWATQADPLIQELEHQRARLAQLAGIQELLGALGGQTMDLAGLRDTTTGQGRIQTALFILPSTQTATLTDDPNLLLIQVQGEHHRFAAAIGLPQAIQQLSGKVAQAKGRPMVLPRWIQGTPLENLGTAKERMAHTRDRITAIENELHRLGRQLGIRDHVESVGQLAWFFKTVHTVRTGPHFAWLTGWTDNRDPDTINHQLHQVGVRALVGFAGTTPDNPPMILRNPIWARPFELFPRLLGAPAAWESDPSPILALLFPLLFGYMFGDVGQGMVLALVGLLLLRRTPLGALLMVGGVSAIGFGWLFGSFFSREDIIQPLWIHPLNHPLLVLGIPLGFGVLILLTGFLLNALEANRRGLRVQWLREQAGLVWLYAGLLGLFIHPGAGVVALIGLVWFIQGAFRNTDRIDTALGHLGHLPETLMQLGVNTLSFARVGAFALAHAGLSLAVVALAEVAGTGMGSLIVMIAGNALILLLEGLVVSIQTTRLILFEFFLRFYQGAGRPFQPLRPPPGLGNIRLQEALDSISR